MFDPANPSHLRMLKQYETTFIMTPVLSDEEMKDTINKYIKFLEDKGAEIILKHNWGLRKLSYPIQKKSTGFYFLIEFLNHLCIIQNHSLSSLKHAHRSCCQRSARV